MSAKKPLITPQYLARLGALRERRSTLSTRLTLALAFGVCALLVAIAPALDNKQGSLAEAQAQADLAASERFKRLKHPALGYAGLREEHFTQTGINPQTPWGALTRVEPLSYGMGFAIEHAFSSKATCAAFIPMAARIADLALVDGALAHDRRSKRALPGAALCSGGQNALRLVFLDPGSEQTRVAQVPSAPPALAERAPEQNPAIPGGYYTPTAPQATPEQLRQAEEEAARSPRQP